MGKWGQKAPKKQYGQGTSQGRLTFVAAFFIILFASVGVTLVDLQVLHYTEISAQALDQRMVQRIIPARRGDILASDGLPLAQNVSLHLVYAVPWMVEEKEKTALALSPVLGLPLEDLNVSLAKASGYVPLKHWVSDVEYEQIQALKLPGIVVTPEEKRYYPEKNMLSQVLGFVNKDGIGQYGLEKYYDALLSGTAGYLRREQDTSGRSIPIGLNEEVPSVDGAHLILTIDRSVQRIVEEKLKAGVERASAEEGEVIVMDPVTGAVLAMANYPDFDPNDYLASLRDADGNFMESGFTIFNNSSVSVPYEPGSVFKVVTMATGLDTEAFHMGDTVYDPGELVIYGKPIRNWDKLGHGELTLSGCLEISNNVCLAQIAQGTGADNFYRYIQGFGFGGKTGIDLPYESSGEIHDFTDWNEILTATSGFGQGITVTPMQLITAVSAIANRGRLVRPYVVQTKVQEDASYDQEPQVIKQVISQDVAEEVTRMMVNVVERSEGRPGGVPGYHIAGKTGTAQVSKDGEAGYSDDIFVASFVGFAPADAPKFIILVKMKLTPQTHPDLRWGSTAAAPVFRQIAEELFKYYQMPPVGV